MAVKTFTTGEVLTAADTNTYLNNGGLVYVTQTTVGSAVASVTISNCFSSTYDNYRIVVRGGTPSNNSVSLAFKLGASTSSYYSALLYAAWSVLSPTLLTVDNGASWTYLIGSDTQGMGGAIDVFNPNVAAYTRMSGFYMRDDLGGSTWGIHKQATAYTDFTLTPSAGTLTGGTITVYGYRKG